MPYKTVYKEDPQMYEGQQKVLQQGIKGEEIVYTKKNYTTNNRNPLIESLPDGYSYSEVMEDPQDEIISIGTKVNPVASRGYSVIKEMFVEATGYHMGTLTKSQTPVHYGDIAVDERIIPLGTKVYIPVLNAVFTATDTGSAIKGGIIDIYFNSTQQCIEWGRQRIQIYILG